MPPTTKQEAQSQHEEQAAMEFEGKVTNTLEAAVEEEPSEVYKIGWRSFLAITALALGNCCAALSN